MKNSVRNEAINRPRRHTGESPFWKTTGLEQMHPEQWEALCDGCGRCCLQKFQNGKTGKVTYTWVACYLLDTWACRCTDYANRTAQVPSCLALTPAQIPRLRWLPKTCAYRLLSEGKDLAPWHPLVSGDPSLVHRAGISVRDNAISEIYVHPEDVEYYTIGYRI
jgi:uncharacterized cysteine cluster protein YcgN (CxxCxxCC family)